MRRSISLYAMHKERGLMTCHILSMNVSGSGHTISHHAVGTETATQDAMLSCSSTDQLPASSMAAKEHALDITK